MPRHKVLRPDDAVSPQEIAKRLCCNAETVKVWIRRGKLKAARAPNGYWWVQEADLAEFIRKETELAYRTQKRRKPKETPDAD